MSDPGLPIMLIAAKRIDELQAENAVLKSENSATAIDLMVAEITSLRTVEAALREQMKQVLDECAALTSELLSEFRASEAALREELAHTCEHVDSLRIGQSALRKELLRQWEQVHEKVCNQTYVLCQGNHPKCLWPKPKILEGER